MKTKFILLLTACLLAVTATAQKRTFTREYSYRASENDSRNTARAAAVREMQTLLLMEIGQALQSEQTLKRLSVTKDGKETFSEDFSQEVMAITAGFVEMKILEEEWDGKTYYIEARMTVDPKEVSQRVAEVLNSKQKEKEGDKAEQAKADVEKRVRELEAQKKEIEARKKEMALKQELARLKEIEAKEQAKQKEIEAKEQAKQKKIEDKELEKQKKMEEAKYAKGWYQPKAFGIGVALANGIEGSVRYTRNISPNFGFDIFKLSGGAYTISHGYAMCIQHLTGLRFATNSFGKNKRTYFYTSVRAGGGYFEYHNYYYGYEGLAIAAELEAGFHFKYFFLGMAVNQGFFKPKLYKEYYETWYYDRYNPPAELGIFDRMPFIGLRLGWDIGKRVAY